MLYVHINDQVLNLVQIHFLVWVIRLTNKGHFFNIPRMVFLPVIELDHTQIVAALARFSSNSIKGAPINRFEDSRFGKIADYHVGGESPD